MHELYLCLSAPEEHFAPSESELMNTQVILHGQFAPDAKWGRNALLFTPGFFTVTDAHLLASEGGWTPIPSAKAPFDVAWFTRDHREARSAAYHRLAEAAGRPLREVEPNHPLIVIMPTDRETILYHHMAVGERGSLYVAYHWAPPVHGALTPEQVTGLIERSKAEWEIARRSYNNSCWYTKWRRDVEMERKYTFSEPVDTWVLIQRLYQTLLDGKLKGFIPEFNDEFQVWDFENYMFEILEPEEQQGYMSFIPQANGQMTVKQKTFREDQEIRTESLTAGVSLTLVELEDYATKSVGGRVRALPPYRRKRFDVNLESLETGNVYGIFFDVCRPLGDDNNALYQCEVEYLRSRVMAPVHNVIEEYEQVCAFTKTFLEGQGRPFREGYYSKLSFLRDYIRTAR